MRTGRRNASHADSSERRSIVKARSLRICLAMLTAIVVPLGKLFWRLEQARARLQTTLDNEKASHARH